MTAAQYASTVLSVRPGVAPPLFSPEKWLFEALSLLAHLACI